MYGTTVPYPTPYRYYANGIDITYYIMNELPLPKGVNTQVLEIVVR